MHTSRHLFRSFGQGARILQAAPPPLFPISSFSLSPLSHPSPTLRGLSFITLPRFYSKQASKSIVDESDTFEDPKTKHKFLSNFGNEAAGGDEKDPSKRSKSKIHTPRQQDNRLFPETYSNKETVPTGSSRHNCIAYATADRFNIKTLREILKKKYEPTWLSKSEDFQVIHTYVKSGGEIFFFSHGSLVFWGVSDDEVQILLKEISLAQVNPYLFLMEKENMEYVTNEESSKTKMIKETIVIATEEKQPNEILKEKLALSNGIARSAKLGVLERQIEKFLSKTKDIPAIMMAGKQIPLSRQEVYQNIGELMNFRGYLNLHSDLLEAPDFYWTEPDLEELFSMISRVLDVNFRISILNRKLDYANELAEVLRTHLSEKHGLKLEWSIIWLIFIEVIFECLHYADRMGLIDPTKWIA